MLSKTAVTTNFFTSKFFSQNDIGVHTWVTLSVKAANLKFLKKLERIEDIS